MHGTLAAASFCLSRAVRRAAGTARRASFPGCGKSNGLMKSTRRRARLAALPALRPTAPADRAEGLPGRVGGLGRCEQHVEPRELRGLPRAPERRVAAELGQLVGRLAAG